MYVAHAQPRFKIQRSEAILSLPKHFLFVLSTRYKYTVDVTTLSYKLTTVDVAASLRKSGTKLENKRKYL